MGGSTRGASGSHRRQVREAHVGMAEALGDFANFRDVATASALLRSDVVWRSDAPMSVDSPEGLTAWPPSVVLDLRDAHEGGAGHPLEHLTRVESIPVLADASPAQMQGMVDLTDLYRLMLVGNGAKGIVRVTEVVAASDGPVLVHCTAGKDRTGVAVALMLTLVGVERDAVIGDYVATAANMPGVLARMIVAYSRVDSQAVPVYEPAKLPASALEAPARAIETVLDIWEQTAGGAAGWFVSAGGDPDVVARLRGRLLLA